MKNIISRLEESESLNYIRKNLIILAVQSWNGDFVQNMNQGLRDKVNVEEVSRNMKKVDHTMRSNTDEILYQSYIPNKKGYDYASKFAFTIQKFPNGLIMVGWYHAYSEGQHFPIRNNQSIKENIGGNKPLSKIDEDFAVNFINVKLIPYVVDKIYVPFLKQYPMISTIVYPRVGYQTFRKNLRKNKVEDWRTVYRISVGKSDINYSNPRFWFDIYKKDRNLIVNISHTLNISPNEKGFIINRWNIDHLLLENVDPLLITPQEEHEATKIITNYLVPDFVKSVNWEVQHDKEVGLENTLWNGKKLEPLTNREVVLGMKKIKRDSSLIIFKFEKGAALEYFAIRKTNFYPNNSDGVMVLFQVGHRSSKGDHHVWDFKTKKWVDDLTSDWAWRAYDSQKKEWDVHLQENITENTEKKFPLSKEDEMRGLHFIRRHLIPIAVHKYNQNYQRPVTEREIDHSMKRFHQQTYPVGGGTDFVVYKSPSPYKETDFNFIFEIYHHNDGSLQASWGYGSRETSQTMGIFKVYSPPESVWDSTEELQENNYDLNQSKFRISKEEESRALDFIRKHLIKMATNSWNRRSSSPIKEEDVRRNLKKTEHKIWDNHWYHDYIKYQFPLPLKQMKSTLQFIIWKDTEERLMAGWEHPLSDGVISRFVGDTNIDEGIKMDDYKVSKMEEDYAVEFIKRKVVPKLAEFINDTNKHFTKHGQVTIQEINRTLKKVNENGRSGMTYQVLILGEPFEFNIFKNFSRELMVHQRSDGTNQKVTYQLNEILTRSNKHTGPISKMEEQYAAEIIKNKIIPDAVKFRNEMSRGEPISNVQDVRRTFKKVGHTRYSEHERESITYQFIINGEPYHSTIRKNSLDDLYIIRGDNGTSIKVR